MDAICECTDKQISVICWDDSGIRSKAYSADRVEHHWVGDIVVVSETFVRRQRLLRAVHILPALDPVVALGINCPNPETTEHTRWFRGVYSILRVEHRVLTWSKRRHVNASAVNLGRAIHDVRRRVDTCSVDIDVVTEDSVVIHPR